MKPACDNQLQAHSRNQHHSMAGTILVQSKGG